jgi:hypothetical protein
MFVYNYIYISIFLYPGTAILREYKKKLSRHFRELHAYLSRGPCWPTKPLITIRSSPAKLRHSVTDHRFIGFETSLFTATGHQQGVH